MKIEMDLEKVHNLLLSLEMNQDGFDIHPDKEEIEQAREYIASINTFMDYKFHTNYFSEISIRDLLNKLENIL